jgi:hypothetical protein
MAGACLTILAEAAQRPTAMGAVLVAGGQFDLLARDVIGNGTALRLVLLLIVRKVQLRGHLGDGDLARFERQLKLLDRLRRGAKAMVAVTRELVAQLLDQHRLRLHLGEQKRREPPQFLGIFRQGFGHVQHGRSYQSKGKTGIPNVLSRPVYPALRGVQLRCGRRQSIPSSSIARLAPASGRSCPP